MYTRTIHSYLGSYWRPNNKPACIGSLTTSVLTKLTFQRPATIVGSCVTNMLNKLDPSQCLSNTNASFIVGDMRSTLTGCNILASLHLKPGNSVNDTESFTYVSHSVKEFFSHMQKVPEKFINTTALHLCVWIHRSNGH